MEKTLPARMKAAVLHAPNDVRVEEVPVPTVGYEDALCRVKAIAICGTDPGIISGKHKGMWPPQYPFIPGHEWAGVVEEVGPGVYTLEKGDRVAAESHKGCGYCRMCRIGRYTACFNYGRLDKGHRHYGFTVNGGYAEYCAISVKCLHKLPDDVSFEEGSLVDTAAVALYGVERARVGPGDTVAVIGPGPVGLNAIQLAKAAGASRVFAAGRGEGRLDLARRMGADEIIDITQRDVAQTVRDITGGEGADIALECAGSVEAVQTAIDVVGRGGRVSLLGFTGRVPVPLVADKIVLNDLEVHGIRADPNTCPMVISLMAAGKLDLRPIISAVFPLSEFNRALEVFTRRINGAVKVIIRP